MRHISEETRVAAVNQYAALHLIADDLVNSGLNALDPTIRSIQRKMDRLMKKVILFNEEDYFATYAIIMESQF